MRRRQVSALSGVAAAALALALAPSTAQAVPSASDAPTKGAAKHDDMPNKLGDAQRELTRDAVQQPQSTVSRHLRQLVEAGWLGVRAEGTSRYYRLHPGLPGHLAELWALIRQDTVGSAEARADAERLRHVLARRGAGGRGFSASAAERWEALRTELFGPRVELASLLGLLEPAWVVADLGCG